MLIHMGWVGGRPPASVLAAVEAVRAASPRCEVVLHTDEAMVPPQWLAVSSTLRPQMRSDVQRHCILRRHGGLWLDVDVKVLADPATWAAGWDRYTAVRLGDGVPFIGTDILYVPAGWAGWPLIEAHIDGVLESIATTKRVKMLALASRMIEACQRQQPEVLAILEPGTVFPARPEMLSPASVVARGFAAPADARPGLGDLVKAGLSAVGITEERVSRAIGRPCGCGKRAAKLNELGHRYLGLPPGQTPPAT